ncbi:G-protein coupled receptor [Oopsacas minuta]|uniref:G-protein coupled receptor n=1 Tax=Oopsacas minuta TaxID=111878 RepID=A0AAV7KDY6_9METZ|nr:G-protein coupled receptor [Oopsacas minuta]
MKYNIVLLSVVIGVILQLSGVIISINGDDNVTNSTQFTNTISTTISTPTASNTTNSTQFTNTISTAISTPTASNTTNSTQFTNTISTAISTPTASNTTTSFAFTPTVTDISETSENETSEVIDDIDSVIAMISLNTSSTQTLVNEYARIVNGINATTIQNQEVIKSVIELTSNMVDHFIAVDNSNQEISTELFSVILILENFIDKFVQIIPPNSLSGQVSQSFGRVQVNIANVNLSVQSDITIPEPNIIFSQSPSTNVPITVLNQLAQLNNVSSFYASSIIFDLSITIQNNAQTTQFLSLNFHLPFLSIFIERISLTFPHNFQNPGLVSNPQCVFINDLAVIDTTGVELVSFNEQVIVCATNHLTSFAAIVRFGRQTDRGEDLASRIVSFLLLSASFLALIISLLLFCLAGKPFFRSLPNLIYFNYAVALTFACGTFIFILPTSVLNNRYCVISSLFTQYIWISVFTWSVCISIVLIQFFKEELVYGEVKYFIIYFLIGWGTPVIPCIITLGITIPNGIIEDYITYNSQLLNLTCYLSNRSPTYTVWGLLGPIMMLLVVNSSALIFLTIRICLKLKPDKINMKSSTKTFYLQYRAIYFQFLILISILGLPWFFAVVNIISGYAIGEATFTILMEWIFIFLNGPIGVVFFFVFTIRNAQVKDLFSKDSKFTIFTSQQAISNFSHSKDKEYTTLPKSLPKPRKPPVISDV